MSICSTAMLLLASLVIATLVNALGLGFNLILHLLCEILRS
jgi:hypothetical protein